MQLLQKQIWLIKPNGQGVNLHDPNQHLKVDITEILSVSVSNLPLFSKEALPDSIYEVLYFPDKIGALNIKVIVPISHVFSSSDQDSLFSMSGTCSIVVETTRGIFYYQEKVIYKGGAFQLINSIRLTADDKKIWLTSSDTEKYKDLFQLDLETLFGKLNLECVE